MNSKHTFRLSALMTALALGASAPAFASSRSNDASLADSMAVGGDTSTTYQRYIKSNSNAADVQGQAAPATQAIASTDMAATEATTASPARAVGTDIQRSRATSGKADTSVASADNSIAAITDTAPAPAEETLVVLIASDDAVAPGTPDNWTSAQADPAAPAEPFAPATPFAPLTALAPEIITREQVRDELRIARASGTVSHTGELADTRDVLIAREEFNAAQADAIVAEYRVQQERQLAQAEADSRRAQLEAEVMELVMLAAMAPAEDASMQARIDVVDVSGE